MSKFPSRGLPPSRPRRAGWGTASQPSGHRLRHHGAHGCQDKLPVGLTSEPRRSHLLRATLWTGAQSCDTQITWKTANHRPCGSGATPGMGSAGGTGEGRPTIRAWLSLEVLGGGTGPFPETPWCPSTGPEKQPRSQFSQTSCTQGTMAPKLAARHPAGRRAVLPPDPELSQEREPQVNVTSASTAELLGHSVSPSTSGSPRADHPSLRAVSSMSSSLHPIPTRVLPGAALGSFPNPPNSQHQGPPSQGEHLGHVQRVTPGSPGQRWGKPSGDPATRCWGGSQAAPLRAPGSHSPSTGCGQALNPSTPHLALATPFSSPSSASKSRKLTSTCHTQPGS